MANHRKIKIAGYAKRIFFNDNIEYRPFSPDLVGFQLTSEGGTTLFTNGNFSVSVNLDPKPDILFTQGTKSKFYTLDDIDDTDGVQSEIQKNIKTKLNLDLTNPLSYVWYGSAKELVRSSLIDIEENWPAAIYVDNKVGSITGNNITEYVYDIATDESTFKVNSNFFVNPYNIKYTLDAKYIPTESIKNPLRNFTTKYNSYTIEHNGIIKNIKSITPATQKTNSEISLVVEGNPFPELTGIFIPQLSFLSTEISASIPYFIKPNEDQIEKFFTGLNDLQRNLLNKDIYPKYRSEIIGTKFTDDGVLLTSKDVYDFPILDDGYNLNFFDSFYVAYLDKINSLAEDLDNSKTDIIVRKYTTEVINSFDTIPRGDGDDLTLNGEKATKLLRIYGVEFDYVKKYINGIKFAHVVTYNKRNNMPDSLVKDLAYMLGLEPINFINDVSLGKLYLPSFGGGQFSGTSTNLTNQQIDVELYRRLILNIAWLWKSKGSRKAVEFLFRFIGAPEMLVNFNEYVVVLDKPLDIEEIKRLLYLYTGQVDLTGIPYDDNGYPQPPINGDLVISDFIDEEGNVIEQSISDIYFQKAGGWYRETYGSGSTTVLNGNNPHIGSYDGGSEYLQHFSKCYIPNFNGEPTVVITADTILQNYFVNYNYGIFNTMTTGETSAFTTQVTFNEDTGVYQPIDGCLDVNYSIIETPLQNDGKTTLQQAFAEAESEYNAFLEQIKENSYLVYSPNWQIIKNNYELSLKNCLNEIETENCDINKTLEICLSPLEKNSIILDCNNFSAVSCLPFIYFTNSDDIKVTFDGIDECCQNLGGKYISYVNEYGRFTEYCSKAAPCVGEPIDKLENGIIVFDLINNTIPKNVIQVGDKCFQYINTDVKLELFEIKFGYKPEEVIKLYLQNKPIEINGFNFAEFFQETFSCSGTIISSPECCAWYGFDYTLVNDGKNDYIACIKGNEYNTPEFNPNVNLSDTNFIVPQIDFTTNNTYYDLQNPVSGVINYYSTKVNEKCFNEAKIVKQIVENSDNILETPILDPTTNSIFSDSTLMDPTNWIINAIDDYGRVSFTPATFLNNFILDWNCTEQSLCDLYKAIAEHYGYSFGYFSIDVSSGLLIPYTGNNPNATNSNDIFSAAIDPNYIGCGEVNDVSIVFGSENYQGFRLPQFPVNESTGEVIEDCSCTIDFSFDYMLKYEASKLIECADNISCFPAIFYDNTFNNINCLNFVVFTSNLDDSQLLQNTFNTSDGSVVWGDTNILPTNVECCNAIGGNVVSITQWSETNQTWVTQIDQTYQNINDADNSGELSSLNVDITVATEIKGYLETYNEIKKQIEANISGCFDLSLSYPSCGIDYESYINPQQTQNICNLEVPLECGLWTKLLTDFKTLINAIETIIEQYNDLCDREENKNNPNESDTIENETSKTIDKIKTYNSLSTQLEKELEKLKEEETKLKEEISDIQNDIVQKNSDNTTIEKALTDVNVPLDCTVYENQITELNNFNYNTYCNTIVYGDPNLNDGTKQSQYTSCVASKTLENQNEVVLYSQLLEDCRTKNSLETQLKNSKFENNDELTNELEKQLKEVNKNINNLTTDYNNSISYDESKQKSDIENNDTLDTINKTADLLDTTPEDITDDSGNLVLTDKQKIDLNIQYNKNKSQISNLYNQLDEKNALLTDNLQKQNEAISGTQNEQNNLGGKLLNWGIGLIGAYYTLKGYLDPETLGVAMAAIGIGSIKDDGGGGGNQGCTLLGGTVYEVEDNSSPTGKWDYVITGVGPQNPTATELCTSFENPNDKDSWTYINGEYFNGCCKAIRKIHTTSSGGGKVEPFNPILTNPASPSNDLAIETPTIKRCNFNNGEFTSSIDGELLFNNKKIPQECCSSQYISNFSEESTIEWVIVNGVGKCVVNRPNNQNGSDSGGIDVPIEPNKCCLKVNLEEIQNLLEDLQVNVSEIEEKTIKCYDKWYETLQENYETYEKDNNTYFDTYLDDLKVNFKLFVNNTNVDTQTSIDTGLTYLPYTESINPIWEWNPSNGYTGVILEGTEQEIATIEDGIFKHLSLLNVPYNADMFEPAWQTFKFTIPECVCDDLRRLYPNKEFFFSIELQNYECSLCLLVDNIKINVSDCKIQRLLSINNCMIPQLSCVIDNKKSWVYYDDGVIKETIYPNGSCNTGSTNNYEIVKLGKQQERLWLDLEYRYTDYNINHSDLILNVKNTVFSIDPAKAIECDVFNYWKNIDCDNCPTICTSANTVVFSGQVYSSTTLEDYTLDLSASTSGITFSCSTLTDLLENQILELKNDYYSLTANYTTSLNATYYELLTLGGTLSKFSVQKNNCGTDTLILSNNQQLDNLFGLITENYDGTISFYESYLYSGSTPYTGGILVEVLSGITAQTFNQTPFVDAECCKKINNLLNSEGVNGMGLGKNYQWDSDINSCVWKSIDGCSGCKGDCEYCGNKKECVGGFATGNTYSVCVNPLDYLDIQPSEINIKAVFDQLVQTNLIDVKSRQTISDYPLLRLFYELYLNASNCGKDLSGKFTYDTMFEFMDKIGDYWLDLLEQVVPATTIWEGCDNSGKIYRNTIFDNNKFNYKRYSLNFIDVDAECPLSAQTDFSIGSESKCTLVEQVPIYPSSSQVTAKKIEIKNKEVEIIVLEKEIVKQNSILCAINLQDLSTPNLQDQIDQQQNVIDLLNSNLTELNQQLIDLNTELVDLENQYIQQQQNYTMNFMSCSGITQNLINAQNNLLTGFTQGTTAYETQRNYIAGLRDKYTKCVRKANTLISDYNTIFITQIYDSNEYEGNVIITGDPDYDDEDGSYYNQELIHNCEN